MRVTAMLAWFDEPPELLAQAVTSAATIADKVLAVDGAWERTPGARRQSPIEQALAIRRAAREAGIDSVIHAPRRLWEGQVAKRNAMLQRAAEDADWVFPLDADWFITGGREAIRSELDATDADQVEVTFTQPVNPDREVQQMPTGDWHKEYAGRTEWVPLLFRALPDMRCERAHWVYSGVKDGVRVGLWGGASFYPAAKSARLDAPCLFEHRCLFRDDARMVRNRDYCALRDQQVAAMGYEL